MSRSSDCWQLSSGHLKRGSAPAVPAGLPPRAGDTLSPGNVASSSSLSAGSSRGTDSAATGLFLGRLRFREGGEKRSGAGFAQRRSTPCKTLVPGDGAEKAEEEEEDDGGGFRSMSCPETWTRSARIPGRSITFDTLNISAPGTVPAHAF